MESKKSEANNSHSVTRFLFIAIICLPAAIHADYSPGPAVDARQFDVSGVKIGMDFQSAVDALVKKYDVSADTVKVVRNPSLSENGGEGMPTSIKLESDPSGGIGIGLPTKGWVIKVLFVPDIPLNENGPVVVSSIEYEMAWTEENKQSLRSASLAKYGDPTVDKQSMGLQWCSEPSTHWAACESEAILDYSGTTLKLIDTRPFRLYNKERQKQNSIKAEI